LAVVGQRIPELDLAQRTVTNARRWGIVGLLFAASLINYLDRATLSLALPAIATELSLGPAAKGGLLSAFFWSYALMQIPVGWCADRVNLKWLYAGMFALWSLACGLAGFAAGLAMLIVLRILLGIGESIYLPGGTKIVSLLFAPKDRGLPAGLFDCGTRAGLVIGGLLVPWLIVQYGWRSMFIVIGFSALLWLIPWFLLFPRRLTGQTSRSPQPTPAAQGTQRRFRIATFDRNLLGICLGFFCFDYYWYLLLTWLPDFLVQVRHLSILRAGFYTALPYFVFGVSQPLGGWIGDVLIRRGWNETRSRKGIVTFAFLTGLLLIPGACVESPNTAIALIVGGSLVGLSTANLLVILQCCAPPDEVGVWTGIQNFAGNLAGITAPLVTGFLISRTGSYLPGFALGPAALVAGIFSYWLIVGELKPLKQSAR